MIKQRVSPRTSNKSDKVMTNNFTESKEMLQYMFDRLNQNIKVSIDELEYIYNTMSFLENRSKAGNDK